MKRSIAKTLSIWGFSMLLCIPISTFATHIIGGEMTYICLGNDQYQFTIIMYRDCQTGGASFDSAPGAFTEGTVSVFRGNSTVEFENIVLDAPFIEQLDISTNNPCLDAPPNICSEQGVYTFVVDLPTQALPYTITYQRCCRNPTISNVIDPNTIGSTFTIELTPEAQTLCNNSPTFTLLPPALVCVNDNLNYDHSALDTDADSLSYSFCAPLEGASQMITAPNPDEPPPYTPVNFNGTFTALQPMGGNPIVSIDPMTGLITGIPTIVGQFVVGVCVSEFRNGVLLSQVQRDFQFNVASCTSLLDADLQSNVFQQDPNGTDVHFVYSCNELDIFVQNESGPSSAIVGYEWGVQITTDSLFISNALDLSLTLPEVGVYDGYLIVNPDSPGGCIDTAFFILEVTPELIATFDTEIDSCSLRPVAFTNTSINTLGDITLEWDFGDGNTATGDATTHSYSSPGVYNMEMTLVDEIGCTDMAFAQIPWFPLSESLNVDLLNTEGCAPLTVEFVPNVILTDDYLVAWDFGDGFTSDTLATTHEYNNLGVFDITLEVTSPIGCKVSRDYPEEVSLDFGIYIPNAFSPNRDGLNEDYCVYSFCDLDDYHLTIYDNWGSLVFESKVQGECWDGKLKNQRVLPGVYTMLLSYTDIENVKQILTSDISLLQ